MATQGMTSYSIKKFADMDYYVRLSLGLPIVLPAGLKPPWGYYKDEENPCVCWPIEREIRCLYKAYELIEKGVGYKHIARWVMQNLQKPISIGTLHSLYKYRRPIVKEIELPLDERERLYRTAETETQTSRIIREARAKKEIREHRNNRSSKETTS